MDALDLARWQFGITTVYHFLFVPLTIGLSLARRRACRRPGTAPATRSTCGMTKFLGKLFLINFAMGVVTGIVQEFQFGMNWSDYSRFVGDVFGAPLAIEGLVAFFLESTFLGLWIFGWDRLPKRAAPGLASGWSRSATNLSAYFILAANSFMQHPVGFQINPETRPGRADEHLGGADQLDEPGRPSRTSSPRAFLTAGGVRPRRSAPGTSCRKQHVASRCASRCRSGFGRSRCSFGAGRRGHRRPAGQGDDRAAADEDGGRRGAVRHRRRPRRSRSSRSAPRTGRASCSPLRVPVPAVVPGDRRLRRRPSRASTTSRRESEERVRPRRLHAEHPGHLLDVPAA